MNQQASLSLQMPSPEAITPERAARLQKALRLRQPTLAVVFENVHDPHNISAVIRSCDAVGVMEAHGIYYGRQEFPDLGSKTSGGAYKWVDLHLHKSVDECYTTLRKRGFSIYSTHMSTEAVSLYKLDLVQPVALVFGNEHIGVSQEACDKADGNFIIPQVGVVQSLNISVACAVSLYEVLRQRMNAGLYDQMQMDDDQFEAKKNDWFSR